MRHLKHPATVIATVALFAALSGGAIAGTLISGSEIKNCRRCQLLRRNRMVLLIPGMSTFGGAWRSAGRSRNGRFPYSFSSRSS
jgi:hypothetical protein